MPPTSYPEIHLHFHEAPGQEVIDKITELTGGVYSLAQAINVLEDQVAADLARITSEVSEIRGVAESAVALISELAAEIRANAADQAALEALADDLDAAAGPLAEAVANRGEEPAPEPEPVPEPVPEPEPAPEPAPEP